MYMKCRHCKKEFNIQELILDCTTHNNKYKYYSCNPCNTKRLKKYRATKIGALKTKQTFFLIEDKRKCRTITRPILFDR